MRFPDFPTIMPARRSPGAARFWLSKKWLAPLFRGFHSSLAPTARPGSYAGKPLLRKAFCGFDAHVAKSDYSLWGLRPPNPRGFFDRLRRAAHWERRAWFVYGGRKGNKQGRCRLMVPAAPHPGLCAYWLCALSQRPAWPGGGAAAGRFAPCAREAGAFGPSLPRAVCGPGGREPPAHKRRRPRRSPLLLRARRRSGAGAKGPGPGTSPLPGVARQRAGGLRPPAAAPSRRRFPRRSGVSQAGPPVR